MRYAFVKELKIQSAKNPNIILLTGDLGYTVFEDFRSSHPKQFINVGVSEANMMSLAAGLAHAGKIVFAYSIATFSTMRPFEQIRNDICYPNLPVIIVGSGAGLSYSDAGPSHHALEDIAILRSLPNIKIIAPSDPIETTHVVRYASKTKSPVYIRLGKKGEQNLHTKKYYFKKNKADILKKGDDILFIACGNIVANTLQASVILEKRGVSSSVVNMHTIKPIDEAFLNVALKQFRVIITVEEHTKIGGLGSAVSEYISSISHNAFLYRIGIPDKRIHTVGSQNFLREIYGLTPKKIAYTAFKILSQ